MTMLSSPVFWVLLFVVPVEVYYWLVYFPRAWKDGSNSEINDIKGCVEYLRKGK